MLHILFLKTIFDFVQFVSIEIEYIRSNKMTRFLGSRISFYALHSNR